MLFFKNVSVKTLCCVSLRVVKSDMRFGSSLFLSGNKATEVCATVSPHIDLPERLCDIQKLKENVNRRCHGVDIDKLKDIWEFYSNLVDNKEKLEKLRIDLSNQLASISKEIDKKDECEKFKIHAKIVREDLKNLKASLWSVEENAILQALGLPNVLHYKVPDEESMIYQYGELPASQNVQSHIAIGQNIDCLKYSNPYNYYLKNNAAVFELGIKYYFSSRLRESGFVQFSNPDFTKSAVVEGCGRDHTDSNSVFILHHNEDGKVNEDSRLHLTGGGSLLAFAGYHTRNVLYPTAFPLRYFSLGRQYNPVPETSELGLFEVSQASVAEVFIAVKDSDGELNSELEFVVQTITDIYKDIGYHFKICYTPAKQLRVWESLRVSFQMFSPPIGKYIEVGNISVSDSYISKRLQFCYRDSKIYYFPKLISGTVVSAPKFIGCALEHSDGEHFHLPQVIKDSIL